MAKKHSILHTWNQAIVLQVLPKTTVQTIKVIMLETYIRLSCENVVKQGGTSRTRL